MLLISADEGAERTCCDSVSVFCDWESGHCAVNYCNSTLRDHSGQPPMASTPPK